MNWFDWLVVVMWVLGILGTIGNVGKRRTIITPEVAVGSSVVFGLLIVGMLWTHGVFG